MKLRAGSVLVLGLALAACESTTFGGKYCDVTVETSRSPAEVYVFPYTMWAETGGASKVLGGGVDVEKYKVSTSAPWSHRYKKVRMIFAVRSGDHWDYTDVTPSGEAIVVEIPKPVAR